MHVLERVGWLAAALVLVAFAIPWFLWGDDTVVAGLPLWLWWHVGWMLLAAAIFWLFATRAWGLGVEPEFDERGPGGGSIADGTSSPIADGASDSVADGTSGPIADRTGNEDGNRSAGGGERR